MTWSSVKRDHDLGRVSGSDLELRVVESSNRRSDHKHQVTKSPSWVRGTLDPGRGTLSTPGLDATKVLS